MSFIRDLSNRTVWLIIGLCLALAAGFWMYMHRPKTLPAIAFKDGEGQTVDLEALRAGKEHTLLVFLLPGCPISKFSMGLVQEQYQKWSPQVSFAGVMLSSQQSADQFAEKEELDFPVYGLRDATDPFAINEIIGAIGSSGGTRATVYGGTIVVVDEDRKVVLNLSRDELRGLPDELASLVD